MEFLSDPWGWWIAPFVDSELMRDALLAGLLFAGAVGRALLPLVVSTAWRRVVGWSVVAAITALPLLVVTAGVNVLFGLIAAGWYTSAFWFLAASGTCMMAVDIVLGRVHRRGAAGLLLVGIGYAVANFGVFTVTMSFDAFAIFQLPYIFTAVLGGPGLMIMAAIIIAGDCKKLDWLGVLGFAIWIGCVGFAHLWVIAECSASC